MAYPKKLLNDYETVALDINPHWWYFAKAAIALVVAIAIGIYWMTLDSGGWKDFVGVATLILILGSVAWLVIRYLQWATTNFVVTSERVIFRTGMFAKSGIEIPLDRVNNVIFGQGVFERVIGAGDLLIESGGETGQQRFTDIRHPDEVQKLIFAQKTAKADRHAGGGSSSADVATQLEKLEGLLERGTITQAEFDDQKRKLLGG